MTPDTPGRRTAVTGTGRIDFADVVWLFNRRRLSFFDVDRDSSRLFLTNTISTANEWHRLCKRRYDERGASGKGSTRDPTGDGPGSIERVSASDASPLSLSTATLNLAQIGVVIPVAERPYEPVGTGGSSRPGTPLIVLRAGRIGRKSTIRTMKRFIMNRSDVRRSYESCISTLCPPAPLQRDLRGNSC